MSMQLVNTADANPGDILHVGEGLDQRRVVVVENHTDGVDVIWFWGGVGPYHARLPHAKVYKRLYEDEAQHKRDSYWDYHEDMRA